VLVEDNEHVAVLVDCAVACHRAQLPAMANWQGAREKRGIRQILGDQEAGHATLRKTK